jgi:hypothetical protein
MLKIEHFKRAIIGHSFVFIPDVFAQCKLMHTNTVAVAEDYSYVYTRRSCSIIFRSYMENNLAGDW